MFIEPALFLFVRISISACWAMSPQSVLSATKLHGYSAYSRSAQQGSVLSKRESPLNREEIVDQTIEMLFFVSLRLYACLLIYPKKTWSLLVDRFGLFIHCLCVCVCESALFSLFNHLLLFLFLFHFKYSEFLFIIYPRPEYTVGLALDDCE